MSETAPIGGGLVTNPAELAQGYVDRINTRGTFEIPESEERIIIELDRLVDVSEMNGVYFSQVGKALAIPISYESDEKVNYWSFNSLAFEGRFVTFSVVKIGKIIGATSVRALCLAFNEVTLLPFFEPIEDDQLLYVPALAFDSMSRVDN